MQKIFLVGCLVMGLTACQTIDTKPAETCPLTKLDTQAQEEQCRHFAGEDPYDAARAEFIKKKMVELNCGLFF